MVERVVAQEEGAHLEVPEEVLEERQGTLCMLWRLPSNILERLNLLLLVLEDQEEPRKRQMTQMETQDQ